MDTLLEARLTFRVLLEKYGLVSLAGSGGDAIDWLEGEAVKLVDSINRRRRFMQLVNDARGILNQAQTESKALPNGGREVTSNPHIGRRFRKIRIEPS